MKKAQGLPINVIVIAAILLIVLVLLATIFVGKTTFFGKKVETMCKGTCVLKEKCGLIASEGECGQSLEEENVRGIIWYFSSGGEKVCCLSET